MKRIVICLLGLLAAAPVLSSCKKDFLDETPQSIYTVEGSLVDSLGIEAGMAGLMSVVREQYTYSDNQGTLVTMQGGTDVAIVANPQGIETSYYNYASMTSRDGAAGIWWRSAYRIIANANVLIKAAANAPSTVRPGYKRRIDAEARFYRAYAYNFLATLYGPVPIVDEPVTSARTDYTRAPLAEVNAFIIQDLTAALPNLWLANNTRQPSGRVTRGAAQHLLGEVYLRAGQPALAEAQLQALVGSGLYSLVRARYGVRAGQPGDYYADMFVIGNTRRAQGNTEIIWGIEQQLSAAGVGGGPPPPPAAQANAAQQRRVWVPGYYNVAGMRVADSLGGRGLGRIRLSNWMAYRLYAPNDVRNSKYNLRRRFYYNDPSRPALFGRRVTGLTGTDTLRNITPYITKWNEYNPVDEFGFAMYKDLPMMRLGETYLLLAEAQFRQGNLSGARATLNVLRQRAFNNTAAGNILNDADVTLNLILDERARELIGEEQRRLTLLRTGTLIERTTRLNSTVIPGNLTITGLDARNTLLPIPQTEIDLSFGTLTQNPGY
ncbi:MAG TPA: RagB/SusD family nutrient uptake outer membrane protein [Hymenobacter sp.]|jgi:hypothetical protein